MDHDKKCSFDREQLLKFQAEGREFGKFFEITRTIYSNIERSDFFKAQCFFNLFLEVFFDLIHYLEQLEFKFEKIIGI